MVGAVSLNPYVSSYQYAGGYNRGQALSRDMQVQSSQRSGSVAGERVVSAGRTNGTSSLIGARSIAAAGQVSGAARVSAGRAADPESPVQPVDAASVVQRSDSGSTDYMIPFLRKGMDPAEMSVRMRIQYSGAGAAGQNQAGGSQAAGGEAAQIELPGSSHAAAGEAAQIELPGSSRAAAGVAAQIELPGGSQAAAGEAAQIELPGSSQAAGEEVVQLDLPGTPSGEEVQQGLPGTASGRAAETGLPGDASQTEGADTASEENTPEIAGLSSTDSAEKATEETECKTCKERKYQDGSDDPGVSFKSPGHIAPEQSAATVRGHELEHVVRERAEAQREGRRVISQSVTMQTGICPECGKVYVAGGVTRTTTAAETKPEEIQKDPRWILASAS